MRQRLKEPRKRVTGPSHMKSISREAFLRALVAARPNEMAELRDCVKGSLKGSGGLGYYVDSLHTPESKKGYFLLTMGVGANKLVDWTLSRN